MLVLADQAADAVTLIVWLAGSTPAGVVRFTLEGVGTIDTGVGVGVGVGAETVTEVLVLAEPVSSSVTVRPIVRRPLVLY